MWAGLYWYIQEVISLTGYIKEHESYILGMINSDKKMVKELLAYHQQQIEWLQHERLVHLIVMLFTIILFLSFFKLPEASLTAQNVDFVF